MLRWFRYSGLFAFTAIVLASNYFAFQVELFDDEYEANHPTPSGTCAFTASSLTWESFDKDNAPQAVVVDAGITLFCFFLLPSETPPQDVVTPPIQRIRDKSPPCIASAAFTTLA